MIETDRRPPFLVFLSTLLICLWIIVAAFPFLWTLWGSFKVQGDFFSLADWTNALWGVRTRAETGAAFTGAGYHGAWVTEGFWRAAIKPGKPLMVARRGDTLVLGLPGNPVSAFVSFEVFVAPAPLAGQ